MSTNFQIAFGKAVQEIRASREMTQEDLASATGLHRTYVSDLERGIRNTSLNNAKKIAEALDTPLSAIVNIAETEYA